MNPFRKSVSFISLGPLVIAAALLIGDVAVRYVGAQPQAAPPRVLTAQEFRLTDSQGDTRATLACKADGSPGLTLLDKTGKGRAALGLSDGGSSLTLYDADGKARARIVVEPDGHAGVALPDKDGKLRAEMLVRPDGSPVLAFQDADGKNRATFETQPDGSPSLLLSNKESKGGAALVVAPNGNPNIVFKDKEGALLWSVPEQQQ